VLNVVAPALEVQYQLSKLLKVNLTDRQKNKTEFKVFIYSLLEATQYTRKASEMKKLAFKIFKFGPNIFLFKESKDSFDHFMER